jgi:hypothetical protein
LIRPVVRLADGSALFAVPGRIDRVTSVEVSGQAKASPDG